MAYREPNYIKTVTAKGRKADITVNVNGMFVAEIDGDEISAPSLAECEKLVLKALRKTAVALAIPALLVRQDRWDKKDKISVTPVVVTGVHGRTNNILYKTGDSAGNQLDGYNLTIYDAATTDADEIRRLSAAVVAAEAAFEKYKKDHEITRDHVKAALKKVPVPPSQADEDVPEDQD